MSRTVARVALTVAMFIVIVGNVRAKTPDIYVCRKEWPPPEKIYEIPIGSAPVIGSNRARVTILHYLDYQNPFCFEVGATLERLLKDYPDDVRIAYKQHPAPEQRNAMIAAEAAMAAQSQGKFIEMHHKLMAASHSGKLSRGKIFQIAKGLGLDMEKLTADLKTHVHKTAIEAMTKEAIDVGAGTPASFVNGRLITCVQPYDLFKQLVDEEIARRKPRGDQIAIVPEKPRTPEDTGVTRRSSLPARLTARLRWTGDKPFGDGVLDAVESGKLFLDISNDGEGDAAGVVVVVRPESIDGVTFPSRNSVDIIAPGGMRTIEIPITASLEVGDTKTALTIEVTESRGHDANLVKFPLFTRSLAPPNLALLGDFEVRGSFSGREVPRDVVATVRLRIRNGGPGAARGVTARVAPGKDVTPATGTQDRFAIGDIGPGETREIEYRCYANQHAEEMTLIVDLEEARPRFNKAGSKVVLPLEGSSRPPQVVQFQPEERKPAEIAAALPPLTADVDREIPKSPTIRPTGLAVVFGVEDYASGPKATYAANDATTAEAYFEKLLGIPRDRILLLRNREVTRAQFDKVLDDGGWLARRVRPDSEVFVFFSGHGMPETTAKSAYLMPADGDMNYVLQTGYPLSRMLERLVSLGARRAAIFLDACFSGLSRNGQAIQAEARPLAIPVSVTRTAKLSVYSAAKESQIASSLAEQRHGMFSYYLFKGLGGAADSNHDRKITAGELKEYLERSVPQEAARQDREQWPDVQVEDPTVVLTELR